MKKELSREELIKRKKFLEKKISEFKVKLSGGDSVLSYIKSDEFLSNALNYSSEGIRIIDNNFQIIVANEVYVSLSGQTHDEIIGSKCYNSLCTSSCKSDSCSFARIKNGESSIEDEIAVKSKNGETRYYQRFSKPFKDGNKNVIGVIESFKNITSRKIAYSELKASEEKVRNIFLSSPHAIAVLNNKNKIIECNEAQSVLSGYSINELIGKDILELISANERKTIKKVLTNFTKVNQFKNVECIMLRKNKTEFYADLSASAIKDENGKVLMIVLFTEDISERKIYQEELIREKERAEASDRLKTAFLANMSHEIRTPMNGIIGFSELIENQNLDIEKRNFYTQLIRKRSYDLLHIINEILDISKLESGQMEISPNSFSLNIMLNEIQYFYSIKLEQLNNKDLQLICTKSFKNERDHILADEIKLKQVLNNLVDNAIKYTEKGRIEFGYEEQKSGNELLFFVKDTGIGIPKENLDLIFERFTQTEDYETRQYGGTGLGLPISKGIIELMGGRIWVESVQNQKTIFYFTIPYTPVKVEIKERNGNNKLSNYNWPGNKILIVEDDRISMEYLKEILEMTSVELVFANNGYDAINACKANADIDLVLMDIQLPDLNGYKAIEEIKKIRKDLPIIAQTAYAMQNDRETALNVGCDDYIAKPFNVNKLLSVIDKFF